MRRALALAVAACMGACYQPPSLTSCRYACGGANNDACPGELACVAGRCVQPGESCLDDGGVIDAPPDDAPGDVPGPVACATPGAYTLQPMVALEAHTNLFGVAILDANSDGELDVVVTDGTSAQDAIGLFPGRGDGTFEQRSGSPGGLRHEHIAVGDIDRDGEVDDIVTTLGDGGFGTHLGSSTGPFTYAFLAGGGTQPSDIELFEITGDNLLDAFITSATGNTISILRGEPGAGWAPISTPTTVTRPRGIAIGALLSNDTVPDLAVAGDEGDVVGVHVGQNNATFAGAQATSVGNGPDAVVMASVMPGVTSVITVNIGDSNISVRHGGTGAALLGISNFPTHDGPRALVLADINVDGHLDVVTANGGHTITVLLNDGLGDFSQRRDYSVGMNPTDLAAGDLNGDHRPDLAIAGSAGDTVTIYLSVCPT